MNAPSRHFHIVSRVMMLVLVGVRRRGGGVIAGGAHGLRERGGGAEHDGRGGERDGDEAIECGQVLLLKTACNIRLRIAT